MSINPRLTAILCLRKAFSKQIIPESSCSSKENVDIGILITSRTSERKITQPIRITSERPEKVSLKTSSAVQMIPFP